MCKTEDAVKETKKFAQTLTANHQCDVKTLLLKAPHVIQAFQDLYKFNAFKDELYHPSRILGFQQVTWGVIVFFLQSKLH